MEKSNTYRSKGGRPKKLVRKDQLLGVKCTALERKIIRLKAQEAKISVSEFLLKMGLTGRIKVQEKNLPAEVLKLFASISSVGNNLNQIARKRNAGDELNAIERAELNRTKDEIMATVKQIKTWLYDRKSVEG